MGSTFSFPACNRLLSRARPLSSFPAKKDEEWPATKERFLEYLRSQRRQAGDFEAQEMIIEHMRKIGVVALPLAPSLRELLHRYDAQLNLPDPRLIAASQLDCIDQKGLETLKEFHTRVGDLWKKGYPDLEPYQAIQFFCDRLIDQRIGNYVRERTPCAWKTALFLAECAELELGIERFEDIMDSMLLDLQQLKNDSTKLNTETARLANKLQQILNIKERLNS